MGLTVTGFVAYGIAIGGDDEDGWPEPFEDSSDVGRAYLRATLGREPTYDEECACDRPIILENGRVLHRDEPEGLTTVTTFEAGWRAGAIHPLIAIRRSVQGGTYTGAVTFHPERTRITEETRSEWDSALRDYCDKTGLPWQKPGWLISAVGN